jgi:hypothetical protein
MVGERSLLLMRLGINHNQEVAFRKDCLSPDDKGIVPNIQKKLSISPDRECDYVNTEMVDAP